MAPGAADVVAVAPADGPAPEVEDGVGCAPGVDDGVLDAADGPALAVADGVAVGATSAGTST